MTSRTTQSFRSGELVEVAFGPGSNVLTVRGGNVVGAYVVSRGTGSEPAVNVTLRDGVGLPVTLDRPPPSVRVETRDYYAVAVTPKERSAYPSGSKPAVVERGAASVQPPAPGALCAFALRSSDRLSSHRELRCEKAERSMAASGFRASAEGVGRTPADESAER